MTRAELQVLYRDDAVAVVNKPSGLIVHRGWANDRDNALARTRDALGCYVYPAHRLDRATSGALLFALDADSARTLAQQLQAGTVDKRYLALARGLIGEPQRIDYPLSSAPDKPRVDACTLISPLGYFERYSLVLARPLTGRLHQVRRHLKHIRHPIVGDTRYGDGKHNRAFRERFGLHRLALHAASIAFDHPSSGKRIEVEAPLPADLANPLEAIGLLAYARGRD